MREISKSFGEVRANEGVNLEIHQGETMGLLGENGAGKSTLMNILYGLIQPDSGTIEVDGKEVVMSSSVVALSHGIGMVHQHFMLIPAFTVLENMILGAEPIHFGLLDHAKARSAIIELMEKFGLQADPDVLVADLGVAARQRVEIIRAIYKGAKILVLDEPTAMLSPKETEALFVVLREMTEAGMSLILISHKLQDLMTLTDRITIIRDGHVVGLVLTSETSPQELATLMVGRATSLTLDIPKHKRLEQPLLSVRNARVGHSKLGMVSFDVHGGEIVGIAGIDGSGQVELLEAIVGLRPIISGTISIAGVDVTNLSSYARSEHGLGYVPEDRTAEGLVGAMSIVENSILRRQRNRIWRRFGFLSPAVQLTYAEHLIRNNDVRPPNPKLNVRALSGGNQQKLLIGRELADSPQILIVSQPTRGVDIAAAGAIKRRLLDARAENRAVLVVSLDLDEIKLLCDRVLVLFRGEIVGELLRSETTDDALGLLMAGEKV